MVRAYVVALVTGALSYHLLVVAARRWSVHRLVGGEL